MDYQLTMTIWNAKKEWFGVNFAAVKKKKKKTFFSDTGYRSDVFFCWLIGMVWCLLSNGGLGIFLLVLVFAIPIFDVIVDALASKQEKIPAVITWKWSWKKREKRKKKQKQNKKAFIISYFIITH